jgi:hypothetical protein
MVTDLRGWLRRCEGLSSVKVTCVDGSVHSVAIKGTSPRRFFDAENTILELGAQKLVALDVKGNTLKACELELPEEAETARAAAPAQVGYDAETRRFETVAKLIADAHKDHSLALKAFEHVEKLYTLVIKRLEHLERRQVLQLNAAMRQIDGAEDPTNTMSPMEKLAMGFFQGQMQARGIPTATPASNGASANAAHVVEDDPDGDEEEEVP